MKIWQGDCLSVIKNHIPNHGVDCVVTSPPYNISKKYKSYNDNLPNEEYLFWMEQIAIEFKRILLPNGHIFLNMGYTNINPWIASDVAQQFRKHFVLQNHIIWCKHIKIELDTFGIYKPITSKRYASPVWESIFHFTNQGDIEVDHISIAGEYGPKKGKYTRDYTEAAARLRYKNEIRRKACFQLYKHKIWKGMEEQPEFLVKCEELKKKKPFCFNKLKDEGNIWYITYEPVAKLAKQLGYTSLGNNETGRANHPAIFPVELPTRCLKFAKYNKGWVVLDPFLGTGTTLMACQNLSIHNAIGIDIDGGYVDFAKYRLNKNCPEKRDKKREPIIDSEDLFDQALEEGAKNGVFDELAAQALEDYKAGRTEEI